MRERFNVVIAFLLGVLVTFSSVGWWAEYRVRQAERGAFLDHLLVRDEALTLALPNPVERGLAKSQAATNVMRRGPKHESVRDDIPVGSRR